MAIIYSYPPAQSLLGSDLLVVSKKEDDFSTKSVTLSKLVEFINGQPSGGVGTTNAIVKFTDGPGGLIGDSIMNEDVDKIYVDGQLRIGSSSGASRINIYHDVLNSDTTFSSGGATGSQIIGRRNELYIENCGASRGDIIFKANNGENNGSTDTYFLLDASMADIGDDSKYTRWPDHSRIVLGNTTNVSNLDFEMYHDSGTQMTASTGLGIVTKNGLFIRNEDASEIEIHNDRNSDLTLRSEGDIRLIGSGFNQYFRVDSGLGFSVASKDIRFSDNVKAKFGNSDDLQIYHDSASGDSFINETGPGDLRIQAVDDVWIQGTTNPQARFNDQGVKLYYLGDVKLETNNTGVKIPTAGDGLQLVSPNGTVYTVTVDNSGNLVVT